MLTSTETAISPALIPDAPIEVTCSASDTYAVCYDKAVVAYNSASCNSSGAGSCGNWTQSASSSLSSSLTVSNGFTLTAPSSIAFSQAAAYSANENVGTSNAVTLTRSGDTTSASSVVVSITGGTATSGSDFTGTDFPKTINFAAGETSKTVPITIIDDSLYETSTPETITFSLGDASGATLGTQSTATLNIVDNDTVAGQVTLKGDGTGISNNDGTPTDTDATGFGTQPVSGTPVTHTFTIENDSGAAVTVNSITIEPTGDAAAVGSFMERFANFNWWNLLGIREALAVGEGDFTLNLNPSLPYTITNGSSYSYTLSFTPTAVGLRDGIVVITFSDGSVFRYTISGNGTVATPGTPQNIPVFGPLGLLAMLAGLFWFGTRCRKA